MSQITQMTPEDRKNVVNRGTDWLLGQPFNNVLLILILFAIAWLGYYGLTTAIPSHLKAIQEGYERLESSHREERASTLSTYKDLLEISRRTSSSGNSTAQK